MTKEEIQSISFRVIGNASEALHSFKSAIEASSNFNFDLSDDYFDIGTKFLTKAHLEQTNLINAEVNGEDIPFSIILVHSQDHLMNAMAYKDFAYDNMRLYKKLDNLFRREEN